MVAEGRVRDLGACTTVGQWRNRLEATGRFVFNLQRRCRMWRRAVLWLAAALVALSTSGPVFAGQPPGQLGYEGQPGNQGGGGGNGLRGYEGQPGNQGG